VNGKFGHMGHKRRRTILLSISAGMAVLLAGVGVAGYTLVGHFNANIQQDNITSLLGNQPVDTHPQAENILVMGSDSREGLSAAYGADLTTDQSDTMMIIHVPADRQWAEVMSIPRDSWVNIPACTMGNGQMSSPTQYKINEAFAIGNLDGNKTKLGVACTVKTLEQDTGIDINHFIVVNFTGFENMVAAIGGVPECNPTPIDDPLSGLVLPAGHHVLTPTQALGYVRARYTLGNGSDLERIGRQQAFMSSLVNQVEGKYYNPLAIYRFLDAATKSLTVDSQLGGITGLYNLWQSLRGIPKKDIAFFTLPSYPRSEVVPSDTANVVWTQPEDEEIFTSFNNDVPASSTLFGTSPQPSLQVASSAPATGKGDGASSAARSKSAADPGATTSVTPTTAASPTASASASPGSASTPSPAVSIQARTANQNICSG
jgi:LCP family protein required for cell wall assembly